MIHPHVQKAGTKVSFADFAEDPLKLPRRAAHFLGNVGQAKVKLAVALSDGLFRLCQKCSPPPIGLSPRHPLIVSKPCLNLARLCLLACGGR
jgi:hypothetical protein